VTEPTNALTAPIRHHLVLVPGFVGFDGLGQLDYYAGVTKVFAGWNGPDGRQSRDVSIHYFDNFPTASVQLRANRLRAYLAERIARGEFAPGDRLSLIGHSTGGLDIRRALFDMAADEEAVLTMDGCCEIKHAAILAMTKRVVFISVPQYGTNLADFAFRFSNTIQELANDAVFALQFNHGALGRLRRRLFSLLPGSNSNFVLALVDMLDESDENPTGTEEQRARQREARFQLTSWLDNIANDFSIIEDLRSFSPDGEPPKEGAARRTPAHAKSPAHFSSAERRAELESWKKYDLKTHSYASRVPPSELVASGLAERIVTGLHVASPVLDFSAKYMPKGTKRWLFPALVLISKAIRAAEIVSFPLVLEMLDRAPNIVFDIFHAGCADHLGPFREPDVIAPTFTRLGSATPISRSEIAVGDSDGVVNTLSMFWPYDPNEPTEYPIDLVDADHGDVIGHFELKGLASPEPGGRIYYAYDFFQTRFRFTQDTFEMLWGSVFDFCVS
jgi:triacylglycerol lipase